jgi:hypothetical protein
VILFLDAGARRRFDLFCGQAALGVVERLGADLAHIVDAHQPGRVALLGLVHDTVRQATSRVGTALEHHAADHAQRLVEIGNQFIDELHTARLSLVVMDIPAVPLGGLAGDEGTWLIPEPDQTIFQLICSPADSGTTVASPMGSSAGWPRSRA